MHKPRSSCQMKKEFARFECTFGGAPQQPAEDPPLAWSKGGRCTHAAAPISVLPPVLRSPSSVLRPDSRPPSSAPIPTLRPDLMFGSPWVHRGTSLGSLRQRSLYLIRSTKRSPEFRHSAKNSPALISRVPIVSVVWRSAKNRAPAHARFPSNAPRARHRPSRAHARAACGQNPKSPFAPRKCVQSHLLEPSPGNGATSYSPGWKPRGNSIATNPPSFLPSPGNGATSLSPGCEPRDRQVVEKTIPRAT
jgi:hypothetical protein